MSEWFLSDLYSTNYHLFPAIKALSKTSLLSNIVTQFFRYWLDNNNIENIRYFNKVEIEHNYKMGPSNNSIWHFDRIPAIKFQIYLNDVSNNNGSFKLQPGSHIKTRRYALNELRNDPNPLRLRNYLKCDIENSNFDVISVEAPKGSLIIFDTMCLHLGGNLKAGFRKTVRLTANTPSLSSKYFRGPEITKFDDFFHPYNHVNALDVNPKYLFVE